MKYKAARSHGHISEAAEQARLVAERTAALQVQSYRYGVEVGYIV
jgi:hypothetical protein